jgi:CBS domain containing-hemolysin-like protein
LNAAAWLWTAVLAVAVGGFVSSLFHALSDLSRARLEEIAAEQKSAWRERSLKAVLANLSGHAHAVGLLRILCNATAAVATTLGINLLRAADPSNPPPPGWVDMSLGVPLAAVVVWMFGLIIPASVARHAGEQAVYAFAPFIRLVFAATLPVQAVAKFLDEVVRRLSGQTAQQKAEEIKEEVLSVVEEATQEGGFDEAEADMIEAVVHFSGTTVGQIMTPRTEIEAMELTNDLGRVIAQVRKGGKSRIPVYEGSLDKIVGIFYVKDLMRWLAGEGRSGGKPFALRTILRPAIFVPETKTVRELLQELIEKRVHIAIVADEFGGTAGLVTFEDITEQVFGDIQDEYEVPESLESDVIIEQGGALIDARAYITDVNEQLEPLGIKLPEGEDYDTVGGWVTVSMGRIPGKGDSATLEGIAVEVLEAEPTRVTRVRLSRRSIDPAAESPQGEARDAASIASAEE